MQQSRRRNCTARRIVRVCPAIVTTALLLVLASAAAQAQSATVNVTDFGPKCDGTTDDTAALRAAAAAVPAAGAVLQFPAATCLIKGTIYLKSHTHVNGHGSTLLAGMPWVADFLHGYAMLENVHHAAETVTDADISVNGMTFDYGILGPPRVDGGGKHAVRFDFARNISVTNNVFYMRGAEDAVAGLGVVNMRVQGNEAHDFRNCAYDFWFGSSNVQIIGNHAETAASNQMVNFNPERTSGDSTGMVASGLVMKDNILVGTGPKAIPIQIEPLKSGTSVNNVLATGNKLRNTYFAFRGNTSNATISGNTISDLASGPPAFETYPNNGATPHGITFKNNTIVEPRTQASAQGVIHVEADSSVVSQNTITGLHYSAPFIFHGQFNTQLLNNVTK